MELSPEVNSWLGFRIFFSWVYRITGHWNKLSGKLLELLLEFTKELLLSVENSLAIVHILFVVESQSLILKPRYVSLHFQILISVFFWPIFNF